MFFALFNYHLAMLLIAVMSFGTAGFAFVLVAYVATYFLLRKWRSLEISTHNAILGFFAAVLLLTVAFVVVYFAVMRSLPGDRTSMYDPLAAVVLMGAVFMVIPPLVALVPMGGCWIAIRLFSGGDHGPKLGLALIVLGCSLGALVIAAALAAAFPKAGETEDMARSIERGKLARMTPEQRKAYQKAEEQKVEEKWREEVREFARHPGTENPAFQHCKSVLLTSPNAEVVPGQWKQFFRDDGRVKTRLQLRTDWAPPRGPLRWYDCVARREHRAGGAWLTLSTRVLDDPDAPDDPALDFPSRPVRAEQPAFDPRKDFEERRAKVMEMEAARRAPAAESARQPLGAEQLAIGYKACVATVARRAGADAQSPAAPADGQYDELDDGSVRFRVVSASGGRETAFDCVAKAASPNVWFVRSLKEAGK